MAEQQACQGSHPEEKNSQDGKEKLLTGGNKLNSDGKEDIGKVMFPFSLNILVVLISILYTFGDVIFTAFDAMPNKVNS